MKKPNIATTSQKPMKKPFHEAMVLVPAARKTATTVPSTKLIRPQ